MANLNTYKRLDDGSYGAWIQLDYNKGQLLSVPAGTTVKIKTRNGETHERVVASVVKSYKSGCIVSLVADAVVAAKAAARYQAAKTVNPAPLSAQSNLSNAAKARLYDNLYNEGGDGYNPYRDESNDADYTNRRTDCMDDYLQ